MPYFMWMRGKSVSSYLCILIGQFDRELRRLGKGHEPVEKLGAMAVILWPVIQVDHQRPNMLKACSHASFTTVPTHHFHPKGYWWRILKPNHLSALLDESNERGLSRFRSWLRSQPGIHPAKIERGGREDLLEMNFLQTTVTGLT